MVDVIQDWLIELGMRCAPTKGEEDSTVRVGVYVRGLADMDARAFTPASLESVARQFEFFPAYAVLRKALEKWLNANPPPQVELLPSGQGGMPEGDRVHVETWIRAQQAGKVNERDLAMRLAIVRKMAGAGFDWLVKNNGHAGRLAQRQGWIADADTGAMDDRMRAEWSDPSVVTKRVVVLTSATNDPSWAEADWRSLHLLGGLVARWAPQNLHLIPTPESVAQSREQAGQAMRAEEREALTPSMIPPEALKSADPPPRVSAAAQFQAMHGRPAGSLSPEALVATRKANPLLKPIAERDEDRAAAEKVKATAVPVAVFDQDKPAPEKPFPWNLLPEDEDTDR